MNIKSSMLYKSLVFVVSILFIGVAVQPAIAVNPNSIDSEDDCNICPKVSKTHLVRLRSLINRVETLDNKLSVMSKFHPKLAEKYQGLFDRISTLKEMNNELKSDTPYPILCNIFAVILISTILYMNIIGYLPFDIVYAILIIPAVIILYPVWAIVMGICWEWAPIPEH